MKRLFLMIVPVLFCGMLLASCDSEVEIDENNGIFYVVGYDAHIVVGFPETRVYGIFDDDGVYQGYYEEVTIPDEPANSGGYFFISENLRDTLFANNLHKIKDEYVIGNLFENIIDFPREIMSPYCDQWCFFSEENRFAYKVQITYRPMTKFEETEREDYEKSRVVIGPGPVLPIQSLPSFKRIVIISIRSQ